MQPLRVEDIAARISRWAPEGPQGPLTLEIYPTLTCNLDCRFCDTTDRHRKPVAELSRERLLAIIDEAAELGVRRVFVLCVGEPLVRKDCPDLLRRVKDRGMEGILTTNGTLLGPALAAQLVQTAWDEVHLSLDGPTPEIHDYLRGQAGAFRKTVRAACRLRVLLDQAGASTPRLAIHMVLTSENWRLLPEMIDLAQALGAFRLDVDALVAYRPEQLAHRLLPDEAAAVPEVAARALARAEALGIQSTLAHLLDTRRLDRGQTQVPIPTEPGLGGAPCLKAWHYLVVQADGKTSPCCVLAGQGGSAADQPLARVWQQDPFLQSVRTGMLDKRPLARCKECSWNILGHEAVIRQALNALEPA